MLECHAIDASNGRDNMAYVGQTPWHGLGQALTLGASIDDWKREAGLDFEVRESVVQFRDARTPDVFHMFGDRKVLYRGDTMKPLASVGRGYQTVQPGEVLEFFRELTESQGFTMDTAGALHGGKRVWALAKVSEGSNVLGADRVMPYLLLATSFDGGLATTAKFTAVRVVCHNTITMELWSENSQLAGRTVRVPHNAKFDAGLVKSQLGLAQDSWTRWMNTARRAAAAPLTAEKAQEFTSVVAANTIPNGANPAESKAFRKIMDLFNGEAIGSDLTQGQTAWQWVNSVTEYVDHHKGRGADSRMNRAWFGDGDAIKSQAFILVEDMLA